MVFEIARKVALITGAASGLGLRYAKELLNNGVKGVTLADFDETKGKESEADLNKTFGEGKALFVKTDVSKRDNFEDTFKQTVNHFGFVDILINNAGLMNDAVWEKEIQVNMNGVVHGTTLGLDNYLQNHRQGDEAVILNISSVLGIQGYGYMPVYSGTKAAVIGMTLEWAKPFHYKRSNVRVLALCPGATATPLLDLKEKYLGPNYEAAAVAVDDTIVGVQGVDLVAEEVVKVLKYAKNGTIWIVEYNQPAYEFVSPDRQTMKDNVLKIN